MEVSDRANAEAGSDSLLELLVGDVSAKLRREQRLGRASKALSGSLLALAALLLHVKRSRQPFPQLLAAALERTMVRFLSMGASPSKTKTG